MGVLIFIGGMIAGAVIIALILALIAAGGHDDEN